MKTLKIRMFNRNITIKEREGWVTASYSGQSCSFACQGEWGVYSKSLPKDEYSLDKIKELIARDYNRIFY